eukprot:gene35443-42961_t
MSTVDRVEIIDGVSYTYLSRAKLNELNEQVASQGRQIENLTRHNEAQARQIENLTRQAENLTRQAENLTRDKEANANNNTCRMF